MSSPAVTSRPFDPGTTGWTVADLHDPAVQREWSGGRYELVDGVLTKMPAQYFYGVRALSHLRRVLEDQLRPAGHTGYFHHEVDVVLRKGRVPRPDMIYLTPEQDHLQQELAEGRNELDALYNPILVAPTLVVESLSLGHEDHDRETKRDWYAHGGVPHYWMLDGRERTLECLTLTGGKYVTAAAGREAEIISLTFLTEVVIPLAELWH